MYCFVLVTVKLTSQPETSSKKMFVYKAKIHTKIDFINEIEFAHNDSHY